MDQFDLCVITGHSKKQSNNLPINGNEATMNLNPLILTNIQSSSYFKVTLFKLKTYHEVIDEIYYQVKHLEPWERGSRKTSGQTGMCGGVGNVSLKKKSNRKNQHNNYVRILFVLLRYVGYKNIKVTLLFTVTRPLSPKVPTRSKAF